MTNRNAKTLFGVSLMAVAILSVTGIVLVDAEKSNTTNIPANVIERNAEAWESQYNSEKHFKQTTKETVEYLTADLEPGWNTDVQQASLKSYNLDSMSGKRGTVDQLVSLISTRAQIDGTYSETEAVERYHDYMQSQFPAPQSVKGIDVKIDQLIGDNDYRLALEAYEARNFQASLGAVPEELMESDLTFWGKVHLLGSCSYLEGCDVEEMAKKDTSPNEHEEVVIPQNYEASLYDYILPKAYAAWDDVYHTASQFISANSCDGTPCYFTTSSSGTGELTPNASSGGTHTTDTTIYSYAYSTSSSTNHYNLVSSQLTDPTPTNTLYRGAYDDFVSKSGYLTKSSSEVTYKATNTSEAWDP